MNLIRTDLACELIKGNSKIVDNLKKTEINIDETLSKKFNRPIGKYVTFDTTAAIKLDRHYYEVISIEISKVIKEFVDPKNVLVIGLGNPQMTADALGSKVCRKLFVTRGETRYKYNALCAYSPNVMGVTGIESFDVTKGIVDRIKPSCIIIVDSLASSSIDRLGSSFQVCSVGITPGSGVNNNRYRMDEDSLGTKVISVGVPLVVYATTIIHDIFGNKYEETEQIKLNKISELVVTPRDIDLLVEECAFIISSAINLAVHKELSYSDLLQIK